ncbi:MAG: Gfo/Idh/MocA family protein [Candidatus Nanohaloarchaea archaeon]
MTAVKVYQIGVGDFGRYGFEKLVEMHNHLEAVDVELKGVCDTDFEKRDRAKKFAEANGIDVETFSDVDGMYDAAAKEEGTVMIYDAGPTETHAEHVYESLRYGFFHLAEKPPSMTRDEHIEERKLAEEKDVVWKVDFIERESPVVRKTLELLEGKEIDSIEVFRESTAGIQKMLQPVERAGVKGGDVLDKMIHEIYVLDFLDAAEAGDRFEFVSADCRFFMPKGIGSEKMMDIYGGYTESLDETVATAETKGYFESGDTDVRLHSGWLGLSKEARRAAEHVREKTGHTVLDMVFRAAGDSAFSSEEARFFIVKGERNLLGDMLNKKLFDLDTGEEIETPDLLHDQLYRVIEKTVKRAAGRDVEAISGDEIDTFMNAIFDVRDAAVENAGDFLESLEKAEYRVKQKVVQDAKILEDKEPGSIAG